MLSIISLFFILKIFQINFEGVTACSPVRSWNALKISLMKLSFDCNSCTHKGSWDLSDLARRLNNTERLNLDEFPLDLLNINQIIHRFYCSGCEEKNFKIFDHKQNMLFDIPSAIESCEKCNSPIPIPRLKLFPDKHICALCLSYAEQGAEQEVIYPNVPIDMRGDCPRCISQNREEKGRVGVNYSPPTRDFFLSCSIYPRCHWTSNSYYDELN